MIVPLVKVTLVGPLARKEQVLSDLQTLGCLDMVPLRQSESARACGASQEAREALRFLDECPARRHQAAALETPTGADFAAKVIAAKVKLEQAVDLRDQLAEREKALAPWGEFRWPSPEELAGCRLWFYAIPHKEARRIDLTKLPHALVRRDQQFRYVVVITAEKPGLPLTPLEVTGPPGQLREELDRAEMLVEDLQIERARLSRWCSAFRRELDALDDWAARQNAANQTLDSKPLFALQAWAPRAAANGLRQYAVDQTLALTVREPQTDDDPPTLLANRPIPSAGEDLVGFYMTPGSRTWDPSAIVLIAFAVFFAMIMADAGYSLLLALVLAATWRRLSSSDSRRRSRTILLFVTAASLVYGVLAGSYFGWIPPTDSLLGRLAVVDTVDPALMMPLTILMGIAHLTYANLRRAGAAGSRIEAVAPLAWSGILVGAVAVWLGQRLEAQWIGSFGIALIVGGGLVVILYTQPRQNWGKRLLGGVLGLTKVTSAFGDVLSYLRLFALGLASASLAGAFNNLAGSTRQSVPRIGLVLAALILLGGHALNLTLGIMSGVVHGLRLNFIEFFNWGLPEEGRPFNAFRRKETPHGPLGVAAGLDRDIRPGGAGLDR